MKTKLDRLRVLSRGADKRAAARVCDCLAVIEAGFMHNNERALEQFRRAYNLDPGCDRAWEGILFLTIVGVGDEDLLAWGKKGIKDKESPRRHLMLAYVYVRMQQFGKAEEELRAALQRQPDYSVASLALATVLMFSPSKKSIDEAKRLLDRVETGLNTSDPAFRADFWAIAAVNAALRADAVAAKQSIKKALDIVPGHDIAQSALKALEK